MPGLASPPSVLAGRDRARVSRTPIPREALAVPLTVVALVAMTWGSLTMQSSAAAYVGAESQWAKGQKRAVLMLYRAAALGTAPDLAEFERALTVPTADRRARLALEMRDADYDYAARAFVEGGNHPSDAPTMARLYPVFKQLPVVRHAVSHWERGDIYLDSLRGTARALVAAHGDRAATTALLDRVQGFDNQLTETESGFSSSLGEATRTLALLLGFVALAVGMVLALSGLALFRRATRQSQIAAEADRRRIEEFRAVAEDAPDAIARLDVSGRHVFANAMLARTMGVDAAEFVGRTHTEIGTLIGAPPEFAEQWRKGIDEVLATRAPVAFGVTIPSPSGVREFSVRVAPQLTADGAVESMIAVAREVTEVRASQRALRDRDERQQHAQKIEAVGQLAGGIAHDFNNILTAIIGNLELAREELPELSPAREDVEAAIASSRRATGLTKQLLTFGRKQFVESSQVDLNAIVSETHDMLSRLVGERFHIEAHQHPENIWVNADVTQLQQVLVNLVVNARDAMPDGGTVVIETDISSDDEGRRAVLRVSDSGSGMSAETRARVFEPFFTTKPRGQGTGLGLSIVHGIIAQSGGAIEVTSKLGEGTDICVYLPLMSPPWSASSSVESTKADDATDAPRVTVLLVEDEAPVRNAARRMLERAGHTVVEAQHAEDALLLWKRDQSRFDVLVTDLMMPGMDGWTLLRTLREDRPALPAVVVSGYAGTSEAEDLKDGAVTLRLAKPFGARELAASVQRAIEEASPT